MYSDGLLSQKEVTQAFFSAEGLKNFLPHTQKSIYGVLIQTYNICLYAVWDSLSVCAFLLSAEPEQRETCMLKSVKPKQKQHPIIFCLCFPVLHVVCRSAFCTETLQPLEMWLNSRAPGWRQLLLCCCISDGCLHSSVWENHK